MGAYAVAKIADKLIEDFAGSVVERWSRYRARRFINALASGIAQGAIGEAEVRERIDKTLADEKKSEALFEAYRRVCLAASRDVGPRVIGFLMAKLLAEGRTASDHEERLMMAAETLTDGEFQAFVGFLHKLNAADSDPKTRDSTIWIEQHWETVDDSGLSRGGIDLAPLNLADSHGTWALKLAAAGILAQQVRQTHHPYHADSDRHIDEDGVTIKYTWYVGADRAFAGFLDLLDVASRTDE
ncbi:MAG: hypothetical protein DCC71_06765 [Proteobacteria bacterium]|nr:MAG: hypothetical protein DCC71_06765 [Pseudomonadota bacterium]